jgi:hypothetical protein
VKLKLIGNVVIDDDLIVQYDYKVDGTEMASQHFAGVVGFEYWLASRPIPHESTVSTIISAAKRDHG